MATALIFGLGQAPAPPEASQRGLAPARLGPENPPVFQVDHDRAVAPGLAQMNFVDAQGAHVFEGGFAVVLGQGRFDNAFDRVPTQERQLGHIAEGHHPAQSRNKSAQRVRVVRVGWAKGGAISKTC